MTFLWPEALWLLAAVPLVVAGSLAILRRRRAAALRYAALSTARPATGLGERLRRRLPPMLFLLALLIMVVAVARPAAVVQLPTQQDTIILSMDVSGSMRAKDVEPDRLSAAQAAAKAFVREQPRTTRIGVVAFAGTASLVQAPTQNREDLIAAIDRFQLQRATAIGSGILVALRAIFPDLELDPRSGLPRKPAASRPAEPGSYPSAAIILLTDGQATAGPDPIEAARAAASRGVRIFTVGVGTLAGETLVGEGWSMRVRLDEDTLKAIANVTGGEYFHAGTALDLRKVYRSLNARFVLEKKETEVTALLVAAGALIALVAALLSLFWFHRIL